MGITHKVKANRDSVDKSVWHQERWSVDRGRFFVEKDVEGGDYALGVRKGQQDPLEFDNLDEVRQFISFVALALFDSVIIQIPRERRRKRASL